MLLSEIARYTNGMLIGSDQEINSVSIDTRTLSSGDLFLALKGENFDGHDFVSQVETLGACAIVVEKKMASALPQVIVENSRLALAEIAGAWKKAAQVKTVGITGSNGKTTVKEMVAAILSESADVLFTQGNLNNDIGVPLTLLRLRKNHQYAVVEMGANHVGEIAYSSRYVKPDVSLITNVGAAHLEGFGSLAGVAKAKGEIYENLVKDGTAILNHDDEFYSYWQPLVADKKVLTFGLSEGAEVTATGIAEKSIDNQFMTEFILQTIQGNIQISLPLAGRHNVMNALAASAACLSLNIPLLQIKQGLEAIKPVTGRLQSYIGKCGSQVIDDTYNANPSSLKAGLDVLLACKGEPWVVLGGLAELGRDSDEIHKQIGEMIKKMGVTKLMVTGKAAQPAVVGYGTGADFFSSQDDLIESLHNQLTGQETLLIKGSRSQKMENVVAALVEDFRNG